MTTTIFFYVAINLMMVMGLAPVVGIPCRSFSYGGSAMMTVMICLGILMSMDHGKRACGPVPDRVCIRWSATLNGAFPRGADPRLAADGRIAQLAEQLLLISGSRVRALVRPPLSFQTLTLVTYDQAQPGFGPGVTTFVTIRFAVFRHFSNCDRKSQLIGKRLQMLASPVRRESNRTSFGNSRR